MTLENFLRSAFRRAVLNEMAAVIDLVGCAGFVAAIVWSPCLLLGLIRK